MIQLAKIDSTSSIVVCLRFGYGTFHFKDEIISKKQVFLFNILRIPRVNIIECDNTKTVLWLIITVTAVNNCQKSTAANSGMSHIQILVYLFLSFLRIEWQNCKRKG